MGKGMRAGKKPSGPKQGDMQKRMMQVQAVQARMEALQEELNERELSASAGGGAVSVTVNGRKELTAIQIKPEAVDPDDVETLQDLVMAAANEALRQMDELCQKEMSQLTGGLGIPGF